MDPVEITQVKAALASMRQWYPALILVAWLGLGLLAALWFGRRMRP